MAYKALLRLSPLVGVIGPFNLALSADTYYECQYVSSGKHIEVLLGHISYPNHLYPLQHWYPSSALLSQLT